MQNLRLQLNTPPEINRDMQVTLLHEATGQSFKTGLFLDGTINMSNIPAGAYRVTVNHPNLTAAVYDNRIRVFPDRPTFVPIRIPTDIFSDTPIRQPTEVDLSPPRTQLASAAAASDGQANKQGGQPIFADDWNQLSGIVGDVARATGDLSMRVAPLGHAHPELVDKLQEIQSNFSKFLDVFGKSLAELQRQIQQLALQQRIDSALDQVDASKAPVAATRASLQAQIAALSDVQRDSPFTYSSALKRVGEQITQQLDAVTTADPASQTKPAVQDAVGVAAAMATTTPIYTYDAEITTHARNDRQAASPGLTQALLRRS